MNKKVLLYVLVVVLLISGIGLAVTYNSLVKKDEQVKQTWSEVQNAYQRRLDLVPNLVNIVKGGADFESSTLVQITEARAKAMQTVVAPVSEQTVNEQTNAQNEMATATNRLLIQVENYPQLQGTRAFKDLQVQLEGTERRIKYARKDFNAAVADYNTTVRTFPTNTTAPLLGFKAKDGFAADTGADKAVVINFTK